MQAGTIQIKWDCAGAMDIKASLRLTSETKKLLINMLLDAAKGINEAGANMVMPEGSPKRILAG